MTTATLARTPRTAAKRLPARASHDRAVVNAILDEAVICHVGFAVDGQPFVIPTIHARCGDVLYVHGSAASRMLRTLAGGVPACVTVTLLDGLVLARSAFHHSVNYRSVVLLGRAEAIEDPDEMLAALEAIVDHVVPGRWPHVRPPSAKELKATSVLRLPIDEGSAKVRTGGPIDDEADLALPVWAGVLPLGLAPGAPVADPSVPAATAVPPEVTRWRREGAAS